MSKPKRMKHNVELLSYGNRGARALCSCGWVSDARTTASGAYSAFAEHFTEHANTAPATDPRVRDERKPA